MHCFVFLSLLSHYSTAVFTRVPFFDHKAKGVKGLGPFSDLCYTGLMVWLDYVMIRIGLGADPMHGIFGM